MADSSQEPIAAERLSELIGLIYDCAIDPGRWPVAMEAIRIEIGGANASLDLMLLPSGTSLLNVMTNIPQAYADRMLDYSSDAVDIWGGRSTMERIPLDRPALLTQTAPSLAHVYANRLFQEWAKPQGINDILAIWLAFDGEAVGALGFGLFERTGPLSARDMAVATLLTPHLQRAATINRLLDVAALQRATFSALFDTLAVPVLLVGDGLRLVHANASARLMLDRGGQLCARNGTLIAPDSGTHRALTAAITQIMEDRGGLGRKGLGIPIRQHGRGVGALHVLPLAPSDPLTRSGALAAVFVAHSSASFVAPTEIVAALFGFTPGESRVFDHVAAGRSVAQAAGALGIGESTARTHLLRLYDKTGVRRQAELVHMAASLAIPVAQ